MHHPERHSSGNAIAAFLAGVAVAIAVGGYLLYGPGGRGRRRQIEAWLAEVKENLAERMAHLKNLSQDSYNTLVDEVVEDYAVARDLAAWQARRLASRLKSRYREMRKFARESADEARRNVEEEEEEDAIG